MAKEQQNTKKQVSFSFFDKQPLLGAFSLGILAVLLSALFWSFIVIKSGWQLGVVALLVGFLVGKAVSLGSAKSGQKQFQIISVVLTFIGMFVSEYIISWYFLYQYYLENGYGSLHFFLGASEIVGTVIQSIISEPITLLFWAIAIWTAYTIPSRDASSK